MTGTDKTVPGAEHAAARGSRKERTRARLIAAARIVFSRDGFHESRLVDITAEARTSVGTFYNYFDSKEAIFRALMADVLDELSRSESADPAQAKPGERSPVESIRRANLNYMHGYRRNAQLMKICTFLADGDPEIRAIKLEIDTLFEERLKRAIVGWQRSGIATADLDPVYGANALGYMVDRFCYEYYVANKPYDEDTAVETLTAIWVRALGITAP